MSDVKQLADSLLVSLKAFVDRRGAELRDHFAGELAKVQAKVGPAGERGPQGEPGAPGARGETGAAGNDGAPGGIGPEGPRGADGAQGLIGPAGTQGEPGAQGERGEAGDAGIQGGTGETGARGEVGPAGADGRNGQDGAAGAQGLAGQAGADGRDADPEAVRLLCEDAARRFVEAIPAARDGADGKDGAAGRDGTDGAPGADAYALAVKSGFVGTALAWLESLRGAPGRDAIDGRDGRDGKDGDHGRDAAEIEPLNGIDSEKSYARGTWAKHDCGLWLARRKTKGMDGWDCIVSGVAEVVIECKDERNFALGLRMSDGTIRDKVWTLPIVLDRGVFLHDATYTRGDGVTYGGSFWIAQKEISRGVPGEIAGEFRLAVKKGQSAADAYGIARRNGFSGTEKEWLESLKAKK